MSEKVGLYLKKAEEFEAKAESATDAAIRASYADLARAYRQLAAHRRKSDTDNGK